MSVKTSLRSRAVQPERTDGRPTERASGCVLSVGSLGMMSFGALSENPLVMGAGVLIMIGYTPLPSIWFSRS